MLRFGSTTIPAGHEPPRPGITPRERSQVYRPAVGTRPAYVEDWGLADARPIRFASSASQGLLTGAEVGALMALYESGEAFLLETDLLKPLGGDPDTYTARFDPETTPAFVPATPGGDLYYMDVVVLIQ